MTSGQHTTQDRMGFSAAISAIAVVGFSGNNCGAQHTFSLIVGGMQAINIQEAEDMRTLFPQPSGKSGVVRVGELALYTGRACFAKR